MSIVSAVLKFKERTFRAHILIFSVLISLGLGMWLGRNIFLPLNTLKTDVGVTLQTLNSEINQLKGSLSMCLNDQAESTNLEGKTFNYNDVGIYSLQLEGLVSERTLYNYKRNEIEAIRFIISKEQDRPISINIFALNKAVNLPDLEKRIAEENNLNSISGGTDFPIFYSYEFANFVSPESYVSARIPKTPLAKNVYLSKNNIRMYRGVNSGPKCVYAVTLSFYAKTLRGKQLLVILSKERQDEFNPCHVVETTQEINLLYRDLEKVANTIELSNKD